ncbi:MAG TPA: crossover junction endodeoxyribonuclease RuvC [Xanthomonadales bacterium]|nr:crossover junction endodeoxyribonuclease RuvC [Xanthomonadales bacterium]
MRILGIDPGSRFTGFGIIEVHGDRVVCVTHGVIKALVKSGSGDFPERLGIIFSGIQELIEAYRPDQAAIETVFLSRNPGSALKLGQARGAAMCAAIAGGLTVSEYSPRSVKQAIVGRGSAEKTQVKHMVGVLLQVKDEMAEDAADALAVALCHQHTQQTQQRMNCGGPKP